MLALREHLAVVESDRVTKRSEGTYWCTRHNEPLADEVRPRSLWMYPMQAGFGQVAPVRHLYCPHCRPEYQAPNETGAEPIYTMQLIDVDEELIPTGLMKDLETRGMQLLKSK